MNRVLWWGIFGGCAGVTPGVAVLEHFADIAINFEGLPGPPEVLQLEINGLMHGENACRSVENERKYREKRTNPKK